MLVVLFGITLAVANHATWLSRTVTDTDSFVAALAPLPKDEAVSTAIAQVTVDALVESLDLKAEIAEALPDGFEFLAGRLTEGFSEAGVVLTGEIIRSDAFTTVWIAASRSLHSATQSYLNAIDSGVLRNESGVLSVDLGVVVSQVLAELDLGSFEVPEVEEGAFTVELFELPSDGVYIWLIDLMSSVSLASVLVALALLVAAIAVATNRQRIAWWIGVAITVSMTLSLIDNRYFNDLATGGIEDPVLREGAEAAWSIVFSGLVWQSIVGIAVGAAVLLGSWFAGQLSDSDSAASGLRSRSRLFARSVLDSGVGRFIVAHPRGIEWTGAGIAAAFLLFGPTLPLWGFIAVLSVPAFIVAGVGALTDESQRPQPDQSNDEATADVNAEADSEAASDAEPSA